MTPALINQHIGADNQAQRPELWMRLRIMVLCRHDIASRKIARFLGCHVQTVRTWGARFAHQESIRDRARPGAKRVFGEEISQKIIAFFCQFETLPGYVRWTLSTACQYFKENPDYLGSDITISRASVQRLLNAHALKPHRYRYFLQLSDPDFFPKMEHIIEVYATVPKNLFCFDECTGIQALESVAPALPVAPKRPQYREVEYIRHGAVSVFSVLEVSTGDVFTQVIEDHTAVTIIEVFRQHVVSVSPTQTLHYICDNYASHSTMEVCEAVGELCGMAVPKLPSVDDRRQWLGATDKRIVFHFLPFHGSWLNLIENWFGIMKKSCLNDRSVGSQQALAQNIVDFTQTWNEHHAHPFKWTYDGKDLRGKTVRKFICWLQTESSDMTGKFLGKQLTLLSNLIQDDWDKVPRHDWDRLCSVFEAKQEYLGSIVEGIDANTFKDTKAKTPQAREIKVAKKIEKAKQRLQETISRFKAHIDAALVSTLNCQNEAPN